MPLVQHKSKQATKQRRHCGEKKFRGEEEKKLDVNRNNH
jgi:hypothetical protein